MKKSKLYAALRAANVPDEAAFSAVQTYEDRTDRIETDISLLKWLVTVNMITTITIVVWMFWS
jgi:hypothetical protein